MSQSARGRVLHRRFRLRLPHPEVGCTGRGSKAHQANTEPDHHGFQFRLRPDDGASALRCTAGNARGLRNRASGFLRCGGGSMRSGRGNWRFGSGRGFPSGPGLAGPAFAGRQFNSGRVSAGRPCRSAVQLSAGFRRRHGHRHRAGRRALGGGFRDGGGRCRGSGKLLGLKVRRWRGWDRNGCRRSRRGREKRNVRRRREGYRRQRCRKCHGTGGGSRGHGRRQGSTDRRKKRRGD